MLPSAVDTALASGLDLRPIPEVQPSEVADAVVGSVRSRKGEIAVPSYVGALANAATLTPEPAMRVIRRSMRDERALRPDSEERLAYRAKLEGNGPGS